MTKNFGFKLENRFFVQTEPLGFGISGEIGGRQAEISGARRKLSLCRIM